MRIPPEGKDSSPLGYAGGEENVRKSYCEGGRDNKSIRMIGKSYGCFTAVIRTAEGRGLVLQGGAGFVQQLAAGWEVLREVCRDVDRPLVSLIWFAGITSGRGCAASRRSQPWTSQKSS